MAEKSKRIFAKPLFAHMNLMKFQVYWQVERIDTRRYIKRRISIYGAKLETEFQTL